MLFLWAIYNSVKKYRGSSIKKQLKEEQCVKRASEEHFRQYDIADQGDIASR